MSTRFAHQQDPDFRKACQRIQSLAVVAASDTAIDTYSLEKLGQIKELATFAEARVRAATGIGEGGDRG